MPEAMPGEAAIADAIVELVIQGITLDGKPFRPSDWAERLCGVMSAFGADNRMQYSPYVHPVTASGVRCVVVDVRLEELEPMARPYVAFGGRGSVNASQVAGANAMGACGRAGIAQIALAIGSR